MKVCAFVDFMGTSSHTPEQEYDFIRRAIIGFFDIDKKDLIFISEVYPHQLKNNPCDMYVFDFGGGMPGCDDTVFSHYRELVKQIQDRPNTLFLLWSAWSANKYYVDAVKEECGEFIKFPNVVIRDINNGWVEAMCNWFK